MENDTVDTYRIFGANANTSENFIWAISNGQYQVNSRGKSQKFGAVEKHTRIKIRFVSTLSQVQIIENGIELASWQAVTAGTSNDLALMGVYTSGSTGELGYLMSGRLYAFRLYDGDGQLVRDFVPCYRKSDGFVSAYDMAAGEFVTPYQRTASDLFLKGADV